jgi:Tol biopolymer transport system component
MTVTFRGDPGIYIINVDGNEKSLRKVMNFNDRNSYGFEVSWSPVPLGDGNYWIAFSDKARLANGTLNPYYDIFLVNLDGTGRVQLTDTPSLQEFGVDWSFRGDLIAVTTYDPALHAADIVVYRILSNGTSFTANYLGSVIRVEGSPLKLAHDAYYPDWAKTQDKLVVTAMLDPGAAYDLWIIDWFDLSYPKQLTYTPDVSEGDPSWSPDDKKIVFYGWDYVIWVMNSDGTGAAKQIATPPAGVVFWRLSWRRNL